MIRASIDRARCAEHKPVVVETGVKNDKKGSNLNVPATEESELVESNAELKTTRETTLERQRWQQGKEPRWRAGSEVICMKGSDKSQDGLMKHVGHSDFHLVSKGSRHPKQLLKRPLNPQEMEEPEASPPTCR